MKTKILIVLLTVATNFFAPCSAASDVFKEYFRMRTHVSALVGESKWIARYSANSRGEVFGNAFNKDATEFYRFEGKLKTNHQSTPESVALISSYSKIKVTFSDPQGTIFEFDLFTPADDSGGSYTHKNYHYMLSCFDLYDYEMQNKNSPYRYARYNSDPEILQAARLLVKGKSDFIKRVEQQLQFPFGFSYKLENGQCTVKFVLEHSPAWYSGLQVGDKVTYVVADYVQIKFEELPAQLSKEAKIVDLHVARESSDAEKQNLILRLYRNTALETRLFQPPAR